MLPKTPDNCPTCGADISGAVLILKRNGPKVKLFHLECPKCKGKAAVRLKWNKQKQKAAEELLALLVLIVS